MVIGFDEFLVGLLVLILSVYVRFPTGLLLPIFFRKKFKKFWQRLFENGYWFDEFLVGLLVLMVYVRVSSRFTSSNFFQKKI